MKLYVYDHCPYCVKARMIFGLKNIAVELIFLANDDETTPISFIGKKMLPILQKPDGNYMPESMDIVNYIDSVNPIINKHIKNDEVEKFLDKVSIISSNLLKPRYVKYPFAEFKTPESISYFRNKKEQKPNEFDKFIADTDIYLDQLYIHLGDLEKFITSNNSFNRELSYDDFNLFPLLRNLTIVKNIKYPKKILNYVNTMASLSKIPLLNNNSI